MCHVDVTHMMTEGKQEDVLPKPDWKPPPTIPKEANKTGTNKKTYFVCNERELIIDEFHNKDVLTVAPSNQYCKGLMSKVTSPSF